MSAFYVVETAGPPAAYSKHHRELADALADFLRLLTEAEAEDITLRFSA